jgi:hypothetical protein
MRQLLLERATRWTELLLLPVIGWKLASACFVGTSLVGAYLFTGPVLLILLVGKTTWFKRFLPEDSVAAGEMKYKARQWAKKAGVNLSSVIANGQTASPASDAVSQRGRGLSIRTDVWEHLSDPERDFAVARGVVQVRQSPPAWPFLLARGAIVVLGSAASSLSLWTLPLSWLAYFEFGLRSMGAPGFLQMRREDSSYQSTGYLPFLQESAKTYDRMALDLTGDLDAATSYLSKIASKHRLPNGYQDRIEALSGASRD